MGIPTLISTATSSNVASVSITSGIDSTYDEYMFVMTDVNPATDGAHFQFQVSTDGGSSYGVAKTTTYFDATHNEGDTVAQMGYQAASDLAQSTSAQRLFASIGNGSDECMAGILHLFSPSNTTYVKHFYARTTAYQSSDRSTDTLIAGYVNTTSAVDAIQFAMHSGNLDGVIQLFGIS